MQAQALAKAFGPDKDRSALDVAATWEDGARARPVLCTQHSVAQHEAQLAGATTHGLAAARRHALPMLPLDGCRCTQVQLVMDAGWKSHDSGRQWVTVEPL